MLLQKGVEALEVQELRQMMQRVGYAVANGLEFDVELDRIVRAYQEDRGLSIDGKVLVNWGKTWPRLEREPRVCVCSDPSPRASRLSRGLATLYDSTARRMTPGYRGSRIGAWQRMESGQERAFIVPFASDGSGEHGGTCGHAAWLLTSWWMRAMFPEKGIFPTWRTGRGATRTMPHRMLPRCSIDGEVIAGSLCRGLMEYVASTDVVAELADIAELENPAQWNFIQKRSGHVILVLRIDENMGCIDPRTGIPAVPGLYRLAADGSKRTLGRPWTWRRVKPGEKGPWTIYGMAPVPVSGEIDFGSLVGAPDLPLELES